jgi:hypothetical protein
MSLVLQRRFVLVSAKRRAMKSRVNREIQARFREGLGVRFSGATRQTGNRNRGSEIRDQGTGSRDQAMGIRAQSLYLLVEKRARELGWQVVEIDLRGFWNVEWRVGGHGILPWAQSASGAKHEIEAFLSVFWPDFAEY